MLPKTIACTLTAVPFRPVIRSIRRYSIGLVAHPAIEDGHDGLPELLLGILREWLADVLLVDRLVALDELLEVVGGQIGVELDASSPS